MIKPYYQDRFATVYCGDNTEVIPKLLDLLEQNVSIVTDPPYGMNNNTDYTRFTMGPNGHGKASLRKYKKVFGDDRQFDPTRWLQYEKVVLWGFNHFADKLPVGTTLVWIKRFDGGFGTFLSDAEIAWVKGGMGVYCKRDTSLYADTKNRAHPTQKPVGIMQWSIKKANIINETILDPFMGAGTTLLAAKRLNKKSIGIEIEEKYCEIAAMRLSQEVIDFTGGKGVQIQANAKRVK